MSVKVGIVGVTGYTGGELIRLLLNHPEAQVVAVTVPSMDGEEVRDFAYELANRWGIGKEKGSS